MNKILFGVIGLLFIGAFVFGVMEITRRSADGAREVAAVSASAGTVSDTSEMQVSAEAGAAQKTVAEAGSPTKTDTTMAQAPGTYTMAQIKAHNSSSSCWSAISGSVYDLTAWIGKHPGGEEAIKKLCGVDGTKVFMNQHGGMEKQAAVLATFKIGTLTQ